MINELFRKRIQKHEKRQKIYLGLAALCTVWLLIAGNLILKDTQPDIELTPTRIVLWLSLLPALIGLVVLGKAAQQKPGKGLDPFEDSRTPFLFSWSFRDLSMTFNSNTLTLSMETPYRRSIEFQGESIIKLIDDSLYELGQSLLFSQKTIEKPEGSHFPAYFSASQDYDFITFQDYTEMWFEAFMFIASHSRAVFVFPAITSGVLDEMTALTKSNLLDKTLIVMPPSQRGIVREEQRFELSWRSTQQKLRKDRGFNLPDYTEQGMVYIPCQDFSVKNFFLLDGNIENVVHAVRKLLSELDQTCLPLADIMKELTQAGFTARDSSKRYFARS